MPGKSLFLPKICLAAVFMVGLAIAWPAIAMAEDLDSRSTCSQTDTALAPHDLVQGAHVEGHIAFLHAELGITPAQEPLWVPVAAAMREDVRNLQDAEKKTPPITHGRETAIQYLESRTLFANLRAQGEARFLAALRPLYDKFSEQQKQIADELLIPCGQD